MTPEKNPPPAPQQDNTARIGLWVSLSAAALAALAVLAVAFYTDYQEKNADAAPVAVEASASAVEQTPSSIPTSESQAASIAAETSDQQSQGMTAPSDVGGDESEAAASAAASAPAASQTAVPPQTENPLPASSPAHTILAGETDAEAGVSEHNGMLLFRFAPGKSDFAANTLEALKSTVDGVKAGKKAVIFSHADAESNGALIKERVSAVRNVLLAAGVPESSIEVKDPARGDSRLVRVELQ